MQRPGGKRFQIPFPSQVQPNCSQVYPRPDDTVYVCAGGSKDSLPVPLDPAKVMLTNSFQTHVYFTNKEQEAPTFVY